MRIEVEYKTEIRIAYQRYLDSINVAFQDVIRIAYKYHGDNIRTAVEYKNEIIMP